MTRAGEYALSDNMKTLKWTNEVPTVTGWYWYRDPTPHPDDRRDKIVYLEMSRAGKMLFRDGRLPNDAEAWGGFFAGPIAEPCLSPLWTLAERIQDPPEDDRPAITTPIVE